MTRQLLRSVLVAAITMIAGLAVTTDAQADEGEAKGLAQGNVPLPRGAEKILPLCL